MSGEGRLAREAGRAVFGVDPAGYHSARLDYPPELYDLILDRAGSRQRRAIAEIGPGTGLATQHLLPSATERYVAIEPDPVLADYLRNAFSDDIFEVVNADFVTAPVSGPFDLIAAASVFHWLDPDAALARIRALLGPGGRVAIVDGGRRRLPDDQAYPLNRRVMAYASDRQSAASRAWFAFVQSEQARRIVARGPFRPLQ
ncbi:MAG TPA: class I SAM-dependent methyltransferase [Sphingomonas sp.]